MSALKEEEERLLEGSAENNQAASYPNYYDDGDSGLKCTQNGAYGTTSAEDMGEMLELSMDDAIERLGYGKFQNQLLWATGLCMTADGLEVLLLSFLTLVLTSSDNDWDLTPRQTSNITSCVFLGAILGSLVLGRLADIWGRKPVFSLTAGLIAIFGLATGVAPDYHSLIIFRFLVGFGVGGIGKLHFVGVNLYEF